MTKTTIELRRLYRLKRKAYEEEMNMPHDSSIEKFWNARDKIAKARKRLADYFLLHGDRFIKRIEDSENHKDVMNSLRKIMTKKTAAR